MTLTELPLVTEEFLRVRAHRTDETFAGQQTLTNELRDRLRQQQRFPVDDQGGGLDR